MSDRPTGTLLSYTVRAIPTIPVPFPLIQEAMRYDLPNNMRQMRQVLTDDFAKFQTSGPSSL